MKYFISIKIDNNKGAFGKARLDIEKILEKKGFIPISKKFSFIKYKLIKKFRLQYPIEYCQSIINWLSILKSTKKGDILVFQHPMPSSIIVYHYIKKIKAKGVKIIVIIHDIYSLRDHQDLNRKYYRIKDFGLINQCDVVISHNKYMSKKLVKNGIDPFKIVNLEIFDYLYPKEIKRKICFENKYKLLVAGNIAESKSGYVYISDWVKNNLTLEVYGSNCVQDKLPENVVYKGMFLPDELPEKLNMGFGIVWDGDSIDGCSGNSGEYLKINNPHKASLYLAAGLPVIVWDKSAIADVVKKYGVGICVSSLRDLETRIDALDKIQYEKMCNNVIEFSKRIRSGYFGGQAVEKALSNMMGL